jgi:hypothetical protein
MTDTHTVDNPRAVIGGNFPPVVDPDMLEQARAKVAEFEATGKEWAALSELTSAEQAGKLKDFLKGASDVAKVIDDLRMRAKRPHMERAEQVQKAFAPLIDAVKRMTDTLKPLAERWAKKERDRVQAEAEARAKAAAEEAALREQEAAAARQRGDYLAAAEAEAAATEAEKARAKAEKAATDRSAGSIRSASGVGGTMALRRVLGGEITNLRMLAMHFADNLTLQETLTSLALAEGRRAGVDAVANGSFTLPGFNFTITEKM